MKTKGIIFGVIAVVLLAWVLAWRGAEARRHEVATLREKAAEVARLRREQATLRAAQASGEEVRKLREERESVMRLRQEIARMRERAAERARVVATGDGARAAEKEREPSMTEEFVPAEAWRNAGQATPSDAMETALWAAAGGDLKALAAAIVLEPGAREKAHRLLDRLPREVSAPFHTEEDFIALLTTNDVPLSEAHLLEPKVNPPPPDSWALRVAEFRDEKGQTRTAPVRLYRVSPTEWRLLVPEAAIDKYATLLAGAPATNGGPK